MPPVEESKLAPPGQAKARFIEAMDKWNEEEADRASAALVRTAGAQEIIELFFRYAALAIRS